MNANDIDQISVCRIVQYMYGSAGCRYADHCSFCRFHHFAQAHRRVSEYLKSARAIIGCLLTFADENPNSNVLREEAIAELVEKAKVIERSAHNGENLASLPTENSYIQNQIHEIFSRLERLENTQPHAEPSTPLPPAQNSTLLNQEPASKWRYET